MNELGNESMKFILSRVLENANDTIEELNENKDDDFYKGKRLAYYEVLDTIKSELEARGQDLKEFGLDIDLEKEFLK